MREFVDEDETLARLGEMDGSGGLEMIHEALLKEGRS